MTAKEFQAMIAKDRARMEKYRQRAIAAGKLYRPRTPIRKVGKKRRGENVYYTKKRREFLDRFKLCAVAPELFGWNDPATEIHHTAGRTGKNFLDEATWLPVCRRAHEWIHNHPGQARAKGWLK